MSLLRFLVRQFSQIRLGGSAVLKSKLREALRRGVEAILVIPAMVVFVALRAVRPVVLVRFYSLPDTNIGHLAANTEMYLCERDAGIGVPNQRYVDIVHASGRPVCNQQLFQMWKRSIRICPGWLMQPVYAVTDHSRAAPSIRRKAVGRIGMCITCSIEHPRAFSSRQKRTPGAKLSCGPWAFHFTRRSSVYRSRLRL